MNIITQAPKKERAAYANRKCKVVVMVDKKHSDKGDSYSSLAGLGLRKTPKFSLNGIHSYEDFSFES